MASFMHEMILNLYKVLRTLIGRRVQKPENLLVATVLFLLDPLSHGKASVNPRSLKALPNRSIFHYPLVFLKPHGFIVFCKSFTPILNPLLAFPYHLAIPTSTLI
jgi:hypothetical protein